MRAVRIHQHGGPEVLRLEALPDPIPMAGETLVRVYACALNRLDLFVRRGLHGVTVALPRILGSDVAGEVVGSKQRVLVAPGAGCGLCQLCLGGRDNECREYQILGLHRDGGCAEMIAVPRRSLLPLPDSLDFTAAAALPLVFLTAWNMLVRRARVQPGQCVLVWAGGGGLGGAAIQVAKLWGCAVIATAGTPDAQQRALALGADHAVCHYDPVRSVSKAVRQIVPQGVDVVIEHVGRASWGESLRALAPGGVLVTCGATTGYDVGVDLRFLYARQLSLLGSYMGRRADLDTVMRLVAEDKLRPVVSRVFPLADAARAHAELESGHHFGKLVLACR